MIGFFKKGSKFRSRSKKRQKKLCTYFHFFLYVSNFRSRSKTASQSLCNFFHSLTDELMSLIPGIEDSFFKYSNVVSSGAIKPPLAPISILILQIVIRASMLSFLIAEPQYSTK